MSEIIYKPLIELISENPSMTETIKNQYLLLLSNLTTTNLIETSLFLENIEKINKLGCIIVGFIYDKDDISVNIIASGTIIIEPKIIHDGKNVGHIEDIVVVKHMQGLGISQKVLNLLKLFARENNCYKVILDCDENIKKVYSKNGFIIKGVQMAEYLVAEHPK